MQEHNSNQIQFMKTPKPGDVKTMHVFGKVQRVTILAVHALGTLDIELTDGRCYRLTGLSLI